jgi:hypothetical protein
MGDESPVALKLLEDPDDKCCELSCQTRVIGAAICAGVGVLFYILAFIKFASGDTTFFAILYTVGLLATLGASFFLQGPKKHWDRLKEEPAHAIALVVVIVAVVFIFVACLGIGGKGGTAVAIICLIVQIGALAIFYISMSKITWAAFKGIVSKIFKCD